MVETYPLFAGRNGPAEAAVLLAGGEVAVILDGLDEIAEDLRPLALEALSQQARCRVVLLTRSDEMVAAALKAHLQLFPKRLRAPLRARWDLGRVGVIGNEYAREPGR